MSNNNYYLYKMRSLSFYLVILLTVVSCKSQKGIPTNTPLCLEEGTCKTSISKNQKINLLEDSIGKIYPKIVSGNLVLYKFTYSKNTPKNLADGHYSETILLEFPKETENLILKDKELQKVNLLFERQCFCRGTAGWYKITKGNLHLKKLKNNNYSLSLNFATNTSPQLINKIEETFSLE